MPAPCRKDDPLVLNFVDTPSVAFSVSPTEISAGVVAGSAGWELDPRTITGYETLAANQDWVAGLQAANDKLVTDYGGGVILLPPFSINLSTDVLLDDNITVRGQGSAASEILSTGGAIKSRNFDTNTTTDTGNGETEIRLEGFTFNGNKATVTLAAGVALYGAPMHIRDVLIRDCSGWGLWTEYRATGWAYGPVGGSGGGPAGTPLESHIDHLILIDNDDGNWNYQGPHDTIASHIISVLQHVTGGPQVGLIGIRLHGGGSALQLSNVHCWGGDQETCLSIESGSNRLDNVILEGASDAQLRIDTSGGVLATGLHIFGQNTAGQIGVRMVQCGSSYIQGKAMRLPGGVVKFNGNTGETNGDLGNNFVHFAANIDNGVNPDNPLYTGTPNVRTYGAIVCDTNGEQTGWVCLNSANTTLSFFGQVGATRQTVTDLASLLTALESYGLIIDGS